MGRDGSGQNKLGKIIERIRAELRSRVIRGNVIMWRASVLTIFPDMFPGPLGTSLAGKALAVAYGRSTRSIFVPMRPTSTATVDDTPAGGGPGMVMSADVLAARYRRGGG